MGTSAPAPPGEPPKAPDAGEEDEAEMTSIMDAEQRRALQQAARSGQSTEGAAPPTKAKEAERPTARPPPEAAAVVQEEVAIPKAPAVPSEAPAKAAKEASKQASAPAAPRETVAQSITTWQIVSFVLLVAAVAFSLR
jgi:hypothetical protein